MSMDSEPIESPIIDNLRRLYVLRYKRRTKLDNRSIWSVYLAVFKGIDDDAIAAARVEEMARLEKL